MVEIIRHLLRRKLRTSLTILAVAVGIFTVTAVGGIAEQLSQSIQMTEQDALSRIYVRDRQYRPLTRIQIRQLRRTEGVAGIIMTLTRNIKSSEAMFNMDIAIFVATRSDIPGIEYGPPMPGVELWDGRLPAPGSRTETVITWALAQTRDLEVGDTLIIRERPFEVAGIWEDTPTASDHIAYISYGAAEDQGGIPRIAAIPLPGADPEAVAKRIEAEMGDVRVESPEQRAREARQSVLSFSLIVGASGVMALLIGSFTIVNTMVVSVHERRREIGLKKALGAADTHVLAETIAEAALIGGLGGLLGVLAGAGVAFVANWALFDRLGMRLFLLTPRLTVGAVVFTMLMGMVAGAYPAWRAARLNPVVALRGGGGATYAHRGLRRLIYLIRRNARSILTVGGIAIGIFALVVLGSLVEYLNGFLNDASAGTSDKVAVYRKDANVPFGRSTARVIHRIPGVRGVVLFNWGDPLDEEESEFGTQERFLGIESPTGEYGFEMPVKVDFAEGRNLTLDSLAEVVVGADLAENHGLRLGDTLTIRNRDFTVVGVWERIPQSMMGNINLRAYITLDALAVVLGEANPIGGMTALVAPGHDAQKVAQAIEVELPGIRTRSAQDEVGEYWQVFAILIAVMAGLLSIAVFVGSVSVVNTMVIAVHERTREIGLKKAVGAEDTNILAEVLANAGKLGGLGGTLGVLMAWLLVAGINLFAQQTAGFQIMDMTPRLAVGAVVFSMLLGMVAGLLPAWRAARLDPVVALRTE